MKKLIFLVAIVFIPALSNAQNPYKFTDGSSVTRGLIDIPAMILVLYLVIMLIINIIRTIMDHRLKSKMIDKGVSENIVMQFLQPRNQDVKNQSIKWFLILTGIGAGLTMINFSLPIGIHSIAIMSFSIAASFFGYYYFQKRSEK